MSVPIFGDSSRALRRPTAPGGEREEDDLAVNPLVSRLAAVYDALERRWRGAGTRRTTGTLLVVAFLAALLAIELNRQGALPSSLARLLPTNHFGAVGFAFTVLLVVEVLGLVWALVGSVANAVGKQFELLALILLRKAFLEFAEFGEPIGWEQIRDSVTVIASDTVGALLIFVVLGFYYRIQRHHPITDSAEEEDRFVAAKKVIALALLLIFAALSARFLWLTVTDRPGFVFFPTFYTVLIFSDILIVLFSLSCSSSFHVVFRNSAFALATVAIRIALTAPDHLNSLLGVGAAVYVLGLSLAYNAFVPTAAEARSEVDAEEGWRGRSRHRPPESPFGS